MPTTALLLTRPYRPATCRVNTRGQRISRRFIVMAVCIVIGGAIVSGLLVVLIDAVSVMLVGR